MSQISYILHYSHFVHETIGFFSLWVVFCFFFSFLFLVGLREQGRTFDMYFHHQINKISTTIGSVSLSSNPIDVLVLQDQLPMFLDI